MLLGPDEVVLRSEYAVLLRGQSSATLARSVGVLYLTNQRCVFETQASRGVVRDLRRGREPRIVLDVSLAQLRNVTVVRPRLGRARLHVEVSRGRLELDVLDPESWYRAVADARRSFRSDAGPPAVVHTIERQVVKVRCRYCGSLANEIDGRCPSCGASL